MVTVWVWSISEAVVTQGDNHMSPALQQHPSLIQPCKGSKQLNPSKSVLLTKKLYGDLRVSFTPKAASCGG